MPKPAGDPSVVAVVDIGSNSGRVVVYRVGVAGRLRILASSRASLRLVRDLDEKRRLSAKAEERLLEALADFAALAAGAGAGRTVAVATAAMRDAANGPELIADVKKRLGLEVTVLSGEDEARCGFLGAARSLPVSHGVIFDVGGGSMQVSRFRQRRLVSAQSFPLGSLRLSDAFLRSDPPTAGEIRKLRAHVRGHLEEAGIAPLEPGEELVGTGGTLRNVAKIDRRTRPYPISRLHGYVVTRQGVDEVARLLASRKLKKRALVGGLNEDRGDSIVGGSLAIAALMEFLGAEEVWVSGQGVREGLALRLAGSSDTLPPALDVRQASIEALTRRFDGWDQARAERRSRLARDLLAALDLGVSAEMDEALGEAARILDVGRSVGYFDRHEHVADLVLATDLDGFSHRAIALLSAVVRAAGDEDARPKSYAPLLLRSDREPVLRAAVVLALADDLEERCPPGIPLTLRCSVTRGEARIEMAQLLAWRPRAIDERFARVFGRRLVVVPRSR
jgi:exopolyphosphatase/guanosine-5'-triphosphate,3'-diphosphate pyrophosphatase